MELGLSKCKVVNLVAGRYAELGGILLKSGGEIEELREDGVYNKVYPRAFLSKIARSMVKFVDPKSLIGCHSVL